MKMCQYLFLIVFFAITTNSLSQITSSENGSETHSSEYPSESLQTDINQNTTSDSSSQFCSSNDILNVAFIIGHKIYFGQNDSLYSFDLKLKEIGEKQTIEDFFTTMNIPNTSFKTIRTAVHFDYNRNVGNATDFILIYGDFIAGGINYFGYNSYRFESGLGLRGITDENEMPFGFKTGEKYDNNYWPTNPMSVKPKCVTFDQIEEIIYFIGSLFFAPLFLAINQIKSDSKLENWSITNNVDYEGLFDVFGSVYGLDKRNMIHRITRENESLDVVEKFYAKEFFNCNGNSTLMGITFPSEETTVSDTSVSDTTRENINASELIPSASESEDSSKSDIQTTTTDSTRAKKSSSLLWIIVSIVIVIVLIVILVVVCLLYFKKSESSETKPSIEEQKNSVASNEQMVDMNTVPIPEETESKPTSSVTDSQLGKTTSISTIRSITSIEDSSLS